MNFRPQAASGSSAGDVSSSPATGTHELGGASLSANMEGQFTDAGAHGANSFYTPESNASLVHDAFGGPGQFAPSQISGAESLSLTGSGAESLSFGAPPITGAEHAALLNPVMPGTDAAMAGLVAGANEPISPIIQMIMRMPGAMGLFNSFFEFFSNFFFSQTNLFDLLNPAFLGAQAYTALTHSIHHVPLSLSLLPSHAPILSSLHGMGQPMFTSDLLSQKLNLSLGSASSSALGSPVNSFSSNFNVSGGINLNKPVFEGVPGAGNVTSAKGVLSGPGLSDISSSNHIAGNTRLFSDKITGSNLKSLQTNTSGASSVQTANTNNIPSGLTSNSTSSLSSNSITSGYQGIPAETSIQDGLFNNFKSQGTVEPAGFSYDGQGTASSGMEGSGLGPSGAVSDQLGGGSQDLVAMDNTSSAYGATGDSVKTAFNSPTPEKHLTGLKAKQLTLDSVKPPKSQLASTPKSAPVNSTPVEPKHVAPAKPSASHHKAASHTSSHKPSHHHKTADHKPRHHKEVAKSHKEVSDNTDNQLIAEANPDITGDAAASTYTIQPGDNLWNIAKAHMGDGMKWQDLFDMNQDVIGSNPDLIYPGTTINMPGNVGEIAQSGNVTYTVQPGDNLWNISKAHMGEGQQWGDIYNMNQDVIGSNPSLIHPGQQLSLPQNDPASTALSNQVNGAQTNLNDPTSATTGENSMAENFGEPSADSGVNNNVENLPTQSMNDTVPELRQDSVAPANTTSKQEISYDYENADSSNGFQSTISEAIPKTPGQHNTVSLTQTNAPGQAGTTGTPLNTASNALPRQTITANGGAAYAATLNKSGNTSIVSTSMVGDLSSYIGKQK